MIAETLAQEIMKRRERELTSKSRVYRQTCPRASSINLDCAREMYYQITAWDKKPIPEPYLMARFEEGHEQERKVNRMLLDLGFDIAEGQRDFELKDPITGQVLCTGHIDGRIPWPVKDENGEERTVRVPYEVKSLDPNVYAMINTVEDFNRYDWSKKYPLQIQIYLHFTGEQEGIFILTDCKGHIKIIPVRRDEELQNQIFDQCAFVTGCVEQKKEPEFCNDANKCRKCWAFGRVCTPPINVESALIIDDPEIEVKLEQREKLKDSAKEYESLDKEVKGYFRGKEIAICGDFMITGKAGKMNLKAREASVTETWTTKIEKTV